MANKNKRRRAKTRKNIAIENKSETQASSWLNEIIALFVGFISFSLLISIITNEEFLFYINTKPTEQFTAYQNLMGRVGYSVSSFLLFYFGLCSFSVVIYLALLAVYIWQKNGKEFKEQKILIPFLAVLSALSFLAIFAYINWGPIGGGEIGKWIAQPLSYYFSPTGASIISLVLFLLSFAGALTIKISELFILLLKITTNTTTFIFISLPKLVVRYLHPLYQKSIQSIKKGWQYATKIFQRSPKNKEETESSIKNLTSSITTTTKEWPSIKNTTKKTSKELEIVNRKIKPRPLKHKKIFSSPKNIGNEEHTPPPLHLLTDSSETLLQLNKQELELKSSLIEEKLLDFNIKGKVIRAHPGPVITLFEFEPASGIKLGKITSLQDDLSMALKANSIRIIAPIPGKGTVGVEVPNQQRDIVRLKEVLEYNLSQDNTSSLTVPLGKDIYGEPIICDIASMPHLLMAGATGAGKSVCINAILLSLLYQTTPKELGLILIDPKILELSIYEGIPHLKVPVVTEPKKAKAVLLWAVQEMDRRYKLMKRYGVRSIDGYNRIVEGKENYEPVRNKKNKDNNIMPLEEKDIVAEGTIVPMEEDNTVSAEQMEYLPKIVIVIDELADLMLTVGREIEDLITRLAQKARAAGIHLIVATQRPSVDVVTGLIKANFPARISFRVSSRIDSRTILDSMGAEKLLGKGDMLFLRPGSAHLQRIHGAFVSDNEVKKVVSFLTQHNTVKYDEEILHICNKANEEDNDREENSNDPNYDPLYDKAVELVIQKGSASTSMLQRAFRIGYNRAARIIDTMEQEGIVGPMEGSKKRQVILPSLVEK